MGSAGSQALKLMPEQVQVKHKKTPFLGKTFWRHFSLQKNSRIRIELHCPKGKQFSEIYNTKCIGENQILCGVFRVVSRYPLHCVLYLGNVDYFLDIVYTVILFCRTRPPRPSWRRWMCTPRSTSTPTGTCTGATTATCLLSVDQQHFYAYWNLYQCNNSISTITWNLYRSNNNVFYSIWIHMRIKKGYRRAHLSRMFIPYLFIHLYSTGICAVYSIVQY